MNLLISFRLKMHLLVMQCNGVNDVMDNMYENWLGFKCLNIIVIYSFQKLNTKIINGLKYVGILFMIKPLNFNCN